MANSMRTTVLRPAGNFEHRCIIRHELGFYGILTVGALYQFGGRPQHPYKEVFISAMKYCITQHPFLSASIQDPGSETPIFVRPDYLKLNNHLQLLDATDISSDTENEQELFKDFLAQLSESPAAYRTGIPPWKLVILPLPDTSGTTSSFWACLCYSHSHGDGKSGMAFHRTFLQALQNKQQQANKSSTTHNTIPTPTKISTKSLSPLPPSLESAAKLTITWQYLLSPLLGAYLPKFISSTLGISTSYNGSDSNAWKATPFSYDSRNHTTGLDLITLDAKILTSLLHICRTKDAKLTGLLHQAIVFALSRQLTARGKANGTTTFIASTPIDLRNLIPEHNKSNTFINCVSGANETLPYHPPTQNDHITKATWIHAKETSTYIASRASTLVDQPIGLLAYVSNYKNWMLKQLGNERGETYEISNLGCFVPLSTNLADSVLDIPTKGIVKEEDVDLDAIAKAQTTMTGWTVEQMVFVQPANAIGAALNFNAVSTTGGGLIMTVTWQRGVLGLEDEDEEGFVREVCGEVKRFLVRACEV